MSDYIYLEELRANLTVSGILGMKLVIVKINYAKEKNYISYMLSF